MAKEKQVASVTDQLRQAKQAAAAAAAANNASRGRGDASSELESEKRRSHRLQVRPNAVLGRHEFTRISAVTG